MLISGMGHVWVSEDGKEVTLVSNMNSEGRDSCGILAIKLNDVLFQRMMHVCLIFTAIRGG